MAENPNEMTAVAALAAMAAGRLSCEALTRACLARIEARDSAVHAFAWLDPERALREARLRDRMREAGAPRVLNGLPIGVKDIIDTHDMPTSYGSPIHAGHRPSADAACVALAREAGAVMLGKTVTTEFALRHPGPTANPRDLAHTPGGSSSGSAAAVADFMVPVAFGTQTGGSIIRPASYCGVVGYKPTVDTINPAGVKPLAGSFDTVGLFARSIDDCALVATVLAGDESGGAPLAAMAPSRIGLWRTPAWRHAEPATVLAVETAARQLAGCGAFVEEIALPAEFELFLDAQSEVLRFEAARVFAFERTRHADLLSPSSRDELAAGAAIPRQRYLAAQALHRALSHAVRGRDRAVRPAAVGECAGRSARGARQHRRGDVQSVDVGIARPVRQCAWIFRPRRTSRRRAAHRRSRRGPPAAPLRQVDRRPHRRHSGTAREGERAGEARR